MKKKILAILLSLSALTLVAGCSASETEPENAVSAMEEQAGEETGEPENEEEPEQETAVSEPEQTVEEEEAVVEPEDAQPEKASRIPLENGQPDEGSNAVVYYEFKKDYAFDESKVSGTLEFKIPQLTMRSMEAGKINEDILEYFEDQLDNMDETMKDFSEWGDLGEDGQDLLSECTLDIDYELTYLDDNKICFLLTGYEYNSGAAHGMPFRKSLIYSLEDGERMEAEDLFDVSEDRFGAAFISAFEEHMAESPDDYWEDAMDYVKEAASFDNEDFYLTESGTVFYFDPYTLAAYAYGYIEAEVPYDSVGLK